MSAMKPLCQLAGIDPNQLSKEEKIVLEAELFVRFCDELKGFFSTQYQDYFRTFKFNIKMEDEEMEVNFVRCIINDILLAEEYSLLGIACYTNTPEDVIYEIAIGKNTNPSSLLVRKIIEIHRSIRPELYRAIIKKIIELIQPDKKNE